MRSTNFEFLRQNWPELAELGGYAELYAHSDPPSSRFKSRLLAEHLALLACKGLNLPIADDNFLAMLKELEGANALPKVVLDTFHQVRIAGNKAVHRLSNDSGHALDTVKGAFDLARWWMRATTGTTEGIPTTFQTVKLATAPSPQHEVEQIEKLHAITEALIAENEQLRKQQTALTAEAQAATRKENQIIFRKRVFEAADALRFSEAETRKRLIDTMLLAAGWDVTDPDQVQMEVELGGQPTESGTGYADYVLYDDDGTPLAVIEAKRTAESPAKGRKQAQKYADALEKQNAKGVRPLIILSNGYETTLVDDHGGPASLGVRGYADRQIYGFPSKDSLSYRVKYQRGNMQDPAQLPHRPDIVNRPYQVEAIKAVAECFGEKRHRKALLVQATGTGKTRVAIALAELLMRAGFARRILFLCDRKELRRQAKNAFTQFMPDCNVTVLSRARESGAQIVLATYPAMMKRFQDYDVAWFDLVIADESHRSIYNKYRDLFLYFDALQIGLTATPHLKVSHNTYAMFDCPASDPTYFYEYERAVDDGYLVDFTPIAVTTRFLRDGIRSDQLSDEEKLRLEEAGIDPENLDIEAERLDKQAYNKDTNRKILQNLMENGLRDATENGSGKSIIFARNHVHAELLGKLFQEMYPEFGPDYCAVIDNYNPRAEQLIDDFKTPGSDPVIAVSVDMLDTGIDVPEVLNLVFAKPVKSYVKFWQMIGRGTRLCKDLHGPGKDKERFYLFDHWGNCEYFETARAHEEANAGVSLLERLFEARLTLAETTLNTYDKAAFERTVPLIRAMLKALPDNSLPVQEKYRHKLFVLSGSTLEQFEPATVELLRRELAPLMRYVSIRGEKEAYAFDLLLTELQSALLLESAGAESLRAELDNVLAGLRTNITAVRDKFEHIKPLREKTFWQQALPELLPALEEKRQTLRGIMQYSLAPGTPPSLPPLVLDIADSGVRYAVGGRLRPSKQDMREYRERVRGVLEPHFATDPTLRKLRRGEGLTGGDFDRLASLVLTQNAGVNLADLRDFYPAAPQLEQELRAIVGMEAEVVKERFSVFFHKHPSLNSLQIAFLNLLQKHIQAYGPVRLENLYEAPFTHMSAEGPDGVFPEEGQMLDLIHVLHSLAGGSGKPGTTSA
jgi:type I restriction enzyme R subunit